MNDLEEHFSALLDTISENNKAKSLIFMKRTTDSCSELLLWLDNLNSQFPDVPANVLLTGARASMLEAVAYIGLGLGRAAISAIRSQIDLILSFTFFCEHPREWEQVKNTGSGFQLRSNIDKYHKETKAKFQSKIAIIDNAEGNSVLKLYRILSAHIHGQSPLTSPKSGQFIDLISSNNFIESLIEIQNQVNLCLSNYLTIIFLEMNLSPPLDVQTRIKKNLNSKQIYTIFFDE